MQNIKGKLLRNIEYIFGFLFLLICFLKFDYYFAGKELGGWDTVGHFQLAKVYASGFREFRSLVWDDGWFSGFPAFYFYPPFFYFFVTLLFISLPIKFVTAFCVSIFCIIPLLGYSIYKFFRVYLGGQIPRYYRITLSYSAIFFYLAYAGDGLQGTSIAGMWEGTFVSNLGHALLLISLSDLEMYRKTKEKLSLIKFILISSLLICTHFLSSFFWFIAVFLHLIFFFKFWKKYIFHIIIAILCIFLFSAPSWLNYLNFSSYTSGVFYGYTYPPLLSILGKDVYDKALQFYGKGESFSVNYISLLIISGRIISLFAIFGFLLETRRNIKGSNARSYVTFFSLAFLWLSLDNTVGYIFPGLRIHNYRAFDSFFLGFSMLMVLGIYHLLIRYKDRLDLRWILILFLIFTFRNFLYFNPPAREGIGSPFFDELIPENQKKDLAIIEDRLSKLPTGSLVFPEITRGREFFSTPHFWSAFLRKYRLRNALGLTVESSLYPSLVFNWSFAGLANTFKWGTELDWSNLFFTDIENSYFESQLPAFFQRSGIEYAIGHSRDFKNFIYSRPNSFNIIVESGTFMLVEVLKTEKYHSLPAAFVSDKWLHSKVKLSPKNFLRESNMVIANLHSHHIPLRIINLENDTSVIDSSLSKKFSLIFLYITGDYIEEGYSLARSINDLGIPVVLLRAPAPKDAPLIWDWSPPIYTRINAQLNRSSNQETEWSFSKTSFFPDLIEKNGVQLYHTDSNQIATFGSHSQLSLELPKSKAQVLTLLLFLLPLSYLFVSLIKKTR